MRKVGGVLLAMAMVLPIGLITAGPAGAATGLTCTKLGGTVTWTPSVPKAPASAHSNITLKATLSGCTGTAKIVSGVIALPVIKTAPPRNCTTLATKPPTLTQTGGSITWATTKTKSTLGKITLAPVPKALATYKATAKVTKGQFIGKTLTMTAAFTPNGCPIKSAKLALKKGTKAIIK